MRPLVVLCLVAGPWVLLTGAVATAEPGADQLALGKHLSQDCTACHRRDGTDTGIPRIVGLDRDYFATTMKYYRSGARDNQVMNSVAVLLSDQQIEALAAYFATLKPAEAAKSGKK